MDAGCSELESVGSRGWNECGVSVVFSGEEVIT